MGAQRLRLMRFIETETRTGLPNIRLRFQKYHMDPKTPEERYALFKTHMASNLRTPGSDYWGLGLCSEILQEAPFYSLALTIGSLARYRCLKSGDRGSLGD